MVVGNTFLEVEEGREAQGEKFSTLSLPVSAPVFLTELQNQDVQDGYPMSFDCVVTGQPVPSVRWFKDGKLLEEDDHYMINEDQQGGHQLIITAVVPADMGVYRCLAENSMGVSSTKAELRVERECWTDLGVSRVAWAWSDHLPKTQLLIQILH